MLAFKIKPILVSNALFLTCMLLFFTFTFRQIVIYLLSLFTLSLIVLLLIFSLLNLISCRFFNLWTKIIFLLTWMLKFLVFILINFFLFKLPLKYHNLIFLFLLVNFFSLCFHIKGRYRIESVLFIYLYCIFLYWRTLNYIWLWNNWTKEYLFLPITWFWWLLIVFINVLFFLWIH